MKLAREVAARCWCDEKTKEIEFDSRLAEAFAKRLHVCIAALELFSRPEFIITDEQYAKGFRGFRQKEISSDILNKFKSGEL